MSLKNKFISLIDKVGAGTIVGITAAVIVVGGCAAAYAISTNNDDQPTPEQQEAIESMGNLKDESINLVIDDIEIPWADMGYASLAEYWEDINALHESAKGMAENAIAKYSSVITDEQKTNLEKYESTMVNCMSPDEYQAAIEKFNEITAELELKLNPPKPEPEPETVQPSEPVKPETEPETDNSSSNSSSSSSGNVYTGSYNDFMRDGIIYHKGNKFTYYSERVLPGGGLKIPGRHTSGGFVRDGDGYICLANDKAIGTVVETPWGMGKVYDRGTYGNHYDIYVA